MLFELLLTVVLFPVFTLLFEFRESTLPELFPVFVRLPEFRESTLPEFVPVLTLLFEFRESTLPELFPVFVRLPEFRESTLPEFVPVFTLLSEFRESTLPEFVPVFTLLTSDLLTVVFLSEDVFLTASFRPVVLLFTPVVVLPEECLIASFLVPLVLSPAFVL